MLITLFESIVIQANWSAEYFQCMMFVIGSIKVTLKKTIVQSLLS